VICACVLIASGCGNSVDSEKACFEAARAYAEVTERYVATKNQNQLVEDAWRDAFIAAGRWRKRACGDTI
jgi:hypothetical protein